jgi:hypothetical protein
MLPTETAADFESKSAAQSSIPPIIITMVHGNGGFVRKNAYQSDILQEYIDEEDFNTIIDQATHIAERIYSTKRKSDDLGISRYKLFLTVISILCMLACLFLFYFAILHENTEYENASFGMVISSLGIFGALTVYESCRNSKNQTFKFKDVL